jgi:hypothetical protein
LKSTQYRSHIYLDINPLFDIGISVIISIKGQSYLNI